jgi:4-diphosphocytidyl-2-C-methyl-D-erythritol kinase
VKSESAFAKINLALVVGPLRKDGKHEVVTLL